MASLRCRVAPESDSPFNLALQLVEQRLLSWAADRDAFAAVLRQAFGAEAGGATAEALRASLLGEGLDVGQCGAGQRPAGKLAGGLSPFPYPPYGPLFATSLTGSLDGQEVSASFFDLDTLGSSDLVSTAQFDRASQQTYVVESAIVPAPVPLVLTAVCLSTTRRLRRLSDRLRQHRVKR